MNIKDFYKYNIESAISELISFLPGRGYIYELRYLYYKNKFGKCEGKVVIDFGVWIPEPKRVFLGKNVSLNRFAILAAFWGTITIGDNCLIGPNCDIRSDDHIFEDIEVPIKNQGNIGGNIVIEEDCWLGAHVVVTRKGYIGKGSIIGANSVVNSYIPPHSIAVGAPAKVIKKRIKKT